MRTWSEIWAGKKSETSAGSAAQLGDLRDLNVRTGGFNEPGAGENKLSAKQENLYFYPI